MTCNLERYMREQELECRRISKSANDGTKAQEEWSKTAQALLERRREHILVCEKCKQG